MESVPIKSGDVPDEVIKLLGKHHGNYNLIPFKYYRENLAQRSNVLLFYKSGKDWRVVDRFPGNITKVTAFAFLRRGSGGGGGQTKKVTKSKPTMQDLVAIPALDITKNPASYENTDPTVNISSPSNGAELNTDSDKRYFKNQIEDYTFKEGDTVESVTNGVTGNLYNYPIPGGRQYTPKNPPQAGDPVRIKKGQNLIVSGSVENASNVKLNWVGPKSGNRTVSVQRGKNNETVSWQTEIEAVPGEYTLTAQAGSVKAQSSFTIEGPHWLRLNLFDENDKAVVDELKYQVRFDDGTIVEGRLKQGTDFISGVPFLPFTVEILPGEEKQRELDAIIDQLAVTLKEEIQQVRINAEPMKKAWGEHAWFVKPYVAELYFVKGAAMWVWDGIVGAWNMLFGAVGLLGDMGSWVGKFSAHRDSAFKHFLSNNPDGVKRETEAMKQMVNDVGEDVAEGIGMAENLYFLSNNDRIPGIIKTFAEDYFDALAPQQKAEFVSRYGIDIALMFVAGSGAVIMGIKKADTIKGFLDKALEIIKLLRFKQRVKHPKVDDTVKLGPVKLKKASYEIGKSDGGPGTWQKRSTPTKGAEYQQKVTGSPNGTEYVVKTDLMPSGEKKFDGYNPDTNTVIDAKDWKIGKNGWPPSDNPEWATKGIVKTAKKDAEIARQTGSKLEYHVPSQEKANQLNLLFKDKGVTGIKIVVSPK